MKTRILALSLLTAGVCSSAIAADTYSLAVSAQVLGRCKFTQAAGSTLTMTNVVGGIDPSSATNATGSANITYRCTNGQAPAFTNDTGTHVSGGNMRVADGSGNFMIYTLGLTSGGAGLGFGAASDRTLAVAGTITSANFASAAVGTYTDTVVISVTP
jgi:spore coat protein U-like protein